jgi:hypothetical protein
VIELEIGKNRQHEGGTHDEELIGNDERQPRKIDRLPDAGREATTVGTPNEEHDPADADGHPQGGDCEDRRAGASPVEGLVDHSIDSQQQRNGQRGSDQDGDDESITEGESPDRLHRAG